MPGLTNNNLHFHRLYSGSHASTPGSVADSRARLWSSSYREDVDLSQLHKFWSELSSSSRHDLLRIDKQALFEQVRKNLYCSRCNGLLLEGFSQIILHGKSLRGCFSSPNNCAAGCNEEKCERRGEKTVASVQDDVRDPSVHPWGGLTATRDSMLTLLDCFLDGQPLEVLQNVFDSARARERERELLYPDACGGGGRGWISQGSGTSVSGRGHSLKETCALHTARLSCDALVDFWSALGEETRRSLLRMKEEDFIERLMFRFDSKRFCKDCRRNVLREFKEMKELKRTRKEPRCTRWFCTADTAFRYEVSDTYVQVNWRECFGGDIGSIYQHFEWGLGSAEGNSDILGFEDVGLSEGARVDGLDLGHISAFYITLRAWKRDGRCTEVSVKAHALRGRQCVHRRLIVGDGYVTITKGEGIKRFFEHAEEAEEEEDDDSMDKDGSEPESEGSRFQKHAKSPELARDFLLDAATVIFKEQVEKAFREGTARQNAHTIFVCLALSLLEERIHVACKEISTLEKQNKLLEEEEHEKQEEEQRRERKRLKEKEKKLRRKEKLKGREHDKDEDKRNTRLTCIVGADCDSGSVCSTIGNGDVCCDDQTKDSFRDDGMLDDSMGQPSSPDRMDARSSADGGDVDTGTLEDLDPSVSMDDVDDTIRTLDSNATFFVEQSKAARRRSKIRKGPFMETVSRRLSRRSSLTAYESEGLPRSFVQSICDPARQVKDKFVLRPPRHNKVSYKSDRNSGLQWIEGWTRQSPQKHNHQQHVSPHPKNRVSLKNRQNDTGPAEKDSFIIKKSERKNVRVVGSKQVYRLENSLPGSLQYNWKIMKDKALTSGGGVKRGGPDQHHMGHAENSSGTVISDKVPCVISAVTKEEIKQSSSVNTASMESRPQRDLSTSVTDSHLASTGQQDLIPPSDNSISSFARKKLHTGLTPSGCSEEAMASSGIPAVQVQSFSDEDPTCILRHLPPGGHLDEDLSLSSATSCVTDTSDSVTSDSITTESALEASFPSQMVTTDELFPLLPFKEEEHFGNGVSAKTDLLSDVPEYSAGSHAAICSGKSPSSACHSHAISSDLLPYPHRHMCGHGLNQLGINTEILPIDVSQQSCHMDFSLQYPLLPASLLPLHPPQHFGYPWIHGQCASVPNPGLLPFPHPGSLVLASNPSSFGLPTALLPLPNAFEPLRPVLGFSCLPIPVDSNFTQQRDRHVATKDEAINDITETGHTPGQSYRNERQAEEQFVEHLTDTAQTLTSTLEDASEFSLFHFGGVARAVEDEQEPSRVESSSENLELSKMRCKPLQQEGVGISKRNLPAEEYTLFAATRNNMFGIF